MTIPQFIGVGLSMIAAAGAVVLLVAVPVLLFASHRRQQALSRAPEPVALGPLGDQVRAACEQKRSFVVLCNEQPVAYFEYDGQWHRQRPLPARFL